MKTRTASLRSLEVCLAQIGMVEIGGLEIDTRKIYS